MLVILLILVPCPVQKSACTVESRASPRQTLTRHALPGAQGCFPPCRRFLTSPLDYIVNTSASLAIEAALSRFPLEHLCAELPDETAGGKLAHLSRFADIRMARLWQAYTNALVEKPIITNTWTAAVIQGIGDVAAQRIELKELWAPVDVTRTSVHCVCYDCEEADVL